MAIVSLFIKETKSDLDSILSTLLSVFVGLFINLLVLIVSVTRAFSNNKKKLRINVIEEMFYNITFIITISLLALVLILLKKIEFFDEDLGFCINCTMFYYNDIYSKTIDFLFTFLFAEIVLTIILIIKRIFRLFSFDLEEIKNNIKKQDYINKQKDEEQ